MFIFGQIGRMGGALTDVGLQIAQVQLDNLIVLGTRIGPQERFPIFVCLLGHKTPVGSLEVGSHAFRVREH